MKQSDDLNHRALPLVGGTGRMPALGFGTLIADATETRSATKTALEVGFRHLDCAERYRNEEQVGEAIRESIRGRSFAREDLFVTTKLWNSNHRPERVKPAFEASRAKLQVDYIDLYLIHTPFAFQPGDNQDPRDANGNIIYDEGVTLKDTWRAMESLAGSGQIEGNRIVGYQPGTVAGGVRIGKHQAGRGSGRIASVPAPNRTSGLLQPKRNCDVGLCAAGSRNEARRPGRSRDRSHCQASESDSRAGIARLGSAARHGRPDNTEDSGARQGEL